MGLQPVYVETATAGAPAVRLTPARVAVSVQVPPLSTIFGTIALTVSVLALESQSASVMKGVTEFRLATGGVLGAGVAGRVGDGEALGVTVGTAESVGSADGIDGSSTSVGVAVGVGTDVGATPSSEHDVSGSTIEAARAAAHPARSSHGNSLCSPTESG
jgi:hypothetical protein